MKKHVFYLALLTFFVVLGRGHTLFAAGEITQITVTPSFELNKIISRTFTISIAQNNTVIDTKTITSSAASLSITNLYLSSGIYDIYISIPGYLPKKLTASLQNQGNYSFSIQAGDLNNDGIINSLDWSVMNNAWNTNSSASDLNNDGIVNSVDFSLVNKNWGRVGDIPPTQSMPPPIIQPTSIPPLSSLKTSKDRVWLRPALGNWYLLSVRTDGPTASGRSWGFIDSTLFNGTYSNWFDARNTSRGLSFFTVGTRVFSSTNLNTLASTKKIRLTADAGTYAYTCAPAADKLAPYQISGRHPQDVLARYIYAQDKLMWKTQDGLDVTPSAVAEIDFDELFNYRTHYRCDRPYTTDPNTLSDTFELFRYYIKLLRTDYPTAEITITVAFPFGGGLTSPTGSHVQQLLTALCTGPVQNRACPTTIEYEVPPTITNTANIRGQLTTAYNAAKAYGVKNAFILQPPADCYNPAVSSGVGRLAFAASESTNNYCDFSRALPLNTGMWATNNIILHYYLASLFSTTKYSDAYTLHDQAPYFVPFLTDNSPFGINYCSGYVVANGYTGANCAVNGNGPNTYMKQAALMNRALEPGALNQSKVSYKSDSGNWLEGHRTTAGYLDLREDRLILREFEKTLGYVYWTRKSSRLVPLYSCKLRDIYFLSSAGTCDGGTQLGIEGYMEYLTVSGPNLTTLYMCRTSGSQTDYFNSTDASCEGQVQVNTLGKIWTVPVDSF